MMIKEPEKSITPVNGQNKGIKWVYLFDQLAEVQKRAATWDQVKSILGGKGAGLFDMTRAGVPVPPGFTVTTEACNAYMADGGEFPEGLWDQILDALRRVEAKSGKRFADPANPLLLSVRSGSKFSMPGMMDTVLNLGLNDKVVEALAEETGDARFAYDAYRRLIQMFGTVVMSMPDEAYEDILTETKKTAGVKLDVELNADHWKHVVAEFKKVYEKEVGSAFPTDPYAQLKAAVEAVFKSWNGKRAIDYRNAAGIPHNLGTAVNVQTMVFGNLGATSATGVAFTRNPATGDKVLFGDYLMNAQGEDVVAGIRTPLPIAQLEKEMPEAFAEFLEIVGRLEKHYREMQDVEFTIERGKLWMLQTRDGKRTARAAVKIAVDLVAEGIISKRDAVLRISPEQVSQLLHPQFDPDALHEAVRTGRRIAKGVNASPGAAVGIAAFDADVAEKWGKSGKSVIMIRPETKPDDVHGMLASKGILTSRGGATSHAAVVARQFGVPCVCGAETLEIDIPARRLWVDGIVVHEGDTVSIDGTTGEVYVGEIRRVEPDFNREYTLHQLLGWADEIRKLKVYANADYPKDARRAREYGAQGVGLCRTEHMFFQDERLPLMQAVILAEPGSEEEKENLAKLQHFQHDDFYGILKAMDGQPVIIRLLDPPLHEFMPDHEQLALRAAGLRLVGDRPKELQRVEELMIAVEGLREFNPMLGLRGIRLGILRPAITEMQVRALFEAACDLIEEGYTVRPEIMLAVTNHVNEVKFVREMIDRIGKEILTVRSCKLNYKVGTMIELPRAALTADKMAEASEFFSFGTNDLTQTTFGISRDDAEGKFLLHYIEFGILPENPFQVIDPDGVGTLIRVAVEKGRATRPNLEVGICGEHGGDPKSIAFCHNVGLDYVSCSPFRVPVARLAAAHAALKS
ncbi:MAG: Pyruvate, phosphate dikinase [Anaerolineae bacterium]|nr:MAG: pyruvate phosphate dikinase [Chloroflexi bacterium OLB13]MBV6437462.1 Pyruvate, phosphate dikinase [Anaerolineae bacterium]MEB2364615.1 pyruvate, phosphate dikinase [Chloroflexota bacterium]GIK28301.1 MAG: pyruvate, phosphate dikinase [Chloroflexota bacterium]